MTTPETVDVTVVTPTPQRFKRHYLRDGKLPPLGAKVFTTESTGKKYVIKEIGKKDRYVKD